MANVFLLNPGTTMKATICLFFFLTTTIFIANSARILLDEVEESQPQPQVIGNNLPLPGSANSNPSVTTQANPVAVASATTTLPSGQTPVATTTEASTNTDDEETNVADPPTLPETTEAPAAAVTSPVEDDDISPPVASPDTNEQVQDQQPQLPEEAEVPSATPNETPILGKEPSLSFFMHDILGGSHPSARAVAGIVANTDVTGLPFSKLNNNLFPITGGIPLVNPKLNGIINNNNLPLLVGLNSGQASTVFQNRGTNNVVTGNNNQPFVSAGNLPAGFTLQKLMFGSVTVIDDQLTEGHELGSGVVGRAQGFYLASSLDGTSQTMVITVYFHGEGEHHDGVDDSISFFGVHRTASPESEVAVIGGTGKYENARGYAALETLLKEDQHTTDGVDTILHFNVYLSH